MDPKANLKEQVEIASVDWTGKNTEELSAAEISRLHDAHIRLCDLVISLHEWQKSGGFSPYAR